MATFPGWAQILGPGETQVALLHRWIEAHRNLGPVQAPTQPPTATPTTAQNIQQYGTFKSKLVDA